MQGQLREEYLHINMVSAALEIVGCAYTPDLTLALPRLLQLDFFQSGLLTGGKEYAIMPVPPGEKTRQGSAGMSGRPRQAFWSVSGTFRLALRCLCFVSWLVFPQTEGWVVVALQCWAWPLLDWPYLSRYRSNGCKSDMQKVSSQVAVGMSRINTMQKYAVSSLLAIIVASFLIDLVPHFTLPASAGVSSWLCD